MDTSSTNDTIVTVLAFFYVPLNLATSLFGMNIQQLNRTGQPMWIFIVTTIVAVSLTFFVWMLVEQRLGYVRWRNEMCALTHHAAPWRERGTEYNFVTRLAILVMLIRNGYYRWAWYSGTWIRILTNERIGVDRQFTVKDDSGSPMTHTLTVCDYVCMNIKRENHFKAFSYGSYLGNL